MTPMLIEEEEMWDTAISVWYALPSLKADSGFIQACSIAQRVIDCNGSNSFLTGSKIHFGVRRDFTETATGLKRSVGMELPPPT